MQLFRYVRKVWLQFLRLCGFAKDLLLFIAFIMQRQGV